MVRILSHMAASHEEHAPRLMHDEGLRPIGRIGANSRIDVVLADGIQQSKFSGLLIDPPSHSGAKSVPGTRYSCLTEPHHQIWTLRFSISNRGPKSVPGTRCGAGSDASKQGAQIGARHLVRSRAGC